MSERSALRELVQRRYQWTQELEELHAQVRPMEREILRLEFAARRQQEDVSALEGFSITGLFMGGAKKEERLEQARRKAAQARAAESAARFRLESLRGSIASREGELRASQGSEGSLAQLLSPDAPGFAQVKQLMEHTGRLPMLLSEIGKKQEALRSILQQAGEIHTHGDMRPTATGGRFNDAYAAQRRHSRLCQGLLEELEGLLAEYNALAPEPVSAAGLWRGDPDYWTGAQIEEAIFDRLVGVENWLRELEQALTGDRSLRELEQKLRQCLLDVSE